MRGDAMSNAAPAPAKARRHERVKMQGELAELAAELAKLQAEFAKFEAEIAEKDEERARLRSMLGLKKEKTIF
ncbi:MAG: hypothetical protein LBT62_03290 [Deltaproteobacteria bacterium]|nr:hypothetical protein [Deltaproteobacteria bacterium]